MTGSGDGRQSQAELLAQTLKGQCTYFVIKTHPQQIPAVRSLHCSIADDSGDMKTGKPTSDVGASLPLQ